MPERSSPTKRRPVQIDLSHLDPDGHPRWPRAQDDRLTTGPVRLSERLTRRPSPLERDALHSDPILGEGGAFGLDGTCILESPPAEHRRAGRTPARGWPVSKPEDLSQVLKQLYQVLEQCYERDDPVGEALVLEQLSLSYYLAGDLVDALRLGHQALARLEVLPQTLETCRIHNTLGLCYSSIGHHTDALLAFNRALELARGIESPAMEANALNNIGHVHLSLQEPGAASHFFQECISLKRRLQDGPGQVLGLLNLGLAEHQQEHFDAAIPYYRQALELGTLYGLEVGWIEAMESLGDAHLARGELHLARQCYQRLLEHARAHEHPLEMCAALLALARLALALADHTQAETLLLEAREQAVTHASLLQLSETCFELYQLYRGCQRLEEALAAFEHYHHCEGELTRARDEERQRLVRAALENDQLRTYAQRVLADRKALEDALSTAERNRARAEEARNEAERLALIDGLTGLHNRRALDQRLDQELARYARYGHIFSLVLLDLDHFKDVNDTHGHLVGDDVIRTIGTLLRAHSRQSDIVVRFGGEEFVILLIGISGTTALQLCERFRLAIQTYAWFELSEGLQVTASFGLCDTSESPASARDMIHLADSRLYRAKRTGRNRVCGPESASDPPGS